MSDKRGDARMPAENGANSGALRDLGGSDGASSLTPNRIYSRVRHAVVFPSGDASKTGQAAQMEPSPSGPFGKAAAHDDGGTGGSDRGIGASPGRDGETARYDDAALIESGASRRDGDPDVGSVSALDPEASGDDRDHEGVRASAVGDDPSEDNSEGPVLWAAKPRIRPSRGVARAIRGMAIAKLLERGDMPARLTRYDAALGHAIDRELAFFDSIQKCRLEGSKPADLVVTAIEAKRVKDQS